MYLDRFKNNSKDYLRVVKSQRITNAKGEKTVTKVVVKNIGPLSRFDDGQPDFYERLKKSFKAGIPLIKELEPYCSKEQPLEKFRFTFTEGSPDCFGHPKLFSHILIERILEELGLRNFFSSYKRFSKSRYDIYGFAKLLIFGRLLEPESKCAAIKQNDNYYDPVIRDFNPDNVYDTLDFIAKYKGQIMRRMNTSLVKKARRSAKIIFYDVTNFFFETEDPDKDIVDETGKVIRKGLRKMGVSKEERKLPVVQMGLFMDDNGIPIAVETFPGNTLDHLTLRPALQKNIDGLDFSRFILVADRGIFQYRNLLHLLDSGNGYIISKSLLKSAGKERQWAYDEEGFIYTSENFKYKSKIMRREMKDENGKARTIEEKVIVYWSRNFQARCEKENEEFLEFLERLEKSPESFRITVKESKKLQKFFRDDYVNLKTGELIHSKDIKAFVDFDKVRKYRENMGYYQIVTSELLEDPLKVIDKYHRLTQIEAEFHMMKGDLKTRPVFVRKPEHIDAHLLICMIALIVLRVIQIKISDSGFAEKDGGFEWSPGLSGNRIQNALRKWKTDCFPGGLYRFMDADDPNLKRIFDAFGISIPPKFYRKGDLKHIKTGIKIFI